MVAGVRPTLVISQFCKTRHPFTYAFFLLFPYCAFAATFSFLFPCLYTRTDRTDRFFCAAVVSFIRLWDSAIDGKGPRNLCRCYLLPSIESGLLNSTNGGARPYAMATTSLWCTVLDILLSSRGHWEPKVSRITRSTARWFW